MSESFLDIKHATTAVNHVTQINNSDGEQKNISKYWTKQNGYQKLKISRRFLGFRLKKFSIF